MFFAKKIFLFFIFFIFYYVFLSIDNIYIYFQNIKSYHFDKKKRKRTKKQTEI